jgi:hypothetical protein
MSVGGVMGRAKAVAGGAIVATVAKPILEAPMTRITRGLLLLLLVIRPVALPILGRRDTNAPCQKKKRNGYTTVLLDVHLLPPC